MKIYLLILSIIILSLFLLTSCTKNKIGNIQTKEGKSVKISLTSTLINNHLGVVKIGKQIWMTENLNVDHFQNGDAIPEVQEADKWAKIKIGAWCYYDNNPMNGNKYGKLYNSYAVNDKRRLPR